MSATETQAEKLPSLCAWCFPGSSGSHTICQKHMDEQLESVAASRRARTRRICTDPQIGDDLDNDEMGRVIVANNMTLSIVRQQINEGEIFTYRESSRRLEAARRAEGKSGCGRCRWCLSNHRYGCPHTAQPTDVHAVAVMQRCEQGE